GPTRSPTWATASTTTSARRRQPAWRRSTCAAGRGAICRRTAPRPRAPGRASTRWPSCPACSALSSEHAADDKQQGGRAHERDEERLEPKPGHAVVLADGVEQDAAEQPAHDADGHRPQTPEPPHSRGALRQRSGDQPDHDPRERAHAMESLSLCPPYPPIALRIASKAAEETAVVPPSTWTAPRSTRAFSQSRVAGVSGVGSVSRTMWARAPPGSASTRWASAPEATTTVATPTRPEKSLLTAIAVRNRSLPARRRGDGSWAMVASETAAVPPTTTVECVCRSVSACAVGVGTSSRATSRIGLVVALAGPPAASASTRCSEAPDAIRTWSRGPPICSATCA